MSDSSFGAGSAGASAPARRTAARSGMGSQALVSGAHPGVFMRDSARAFLLGPLLKGVSRSFYLTLRVLPEGMRDPVGLAYLLARAADTIADTPLIEPALRLRRLLALRAHVNGDEQDPGPLREIAAQAAAQQQHSDEKRLLESLEPALAILSQLSERDRAAVRDIVSTLTRGMEFDLRTFPDECSGRIAALRECSELDHYTYLVAGCVGAFWTDMTYAHLPYVMPADSAMMSDRGVRFGKALQMTNVLRDCGKDLRIGRCYLPSTLLKRYGLTPQALLLPDASDRARAVMLELVRHALDHFRDAIDYTLAIRRSAPRLRLACVWPIVIGLKTLLLLLDNEHWLVPERRSKVRRQDVYRVIAVSIPLAGSNALLRAWLARLIVAIEHRLESISRDGG
ncbi:hypothetical protein DFQ28_010972 [Apophysomyces sp. BC1034]|nr:hypothetical protein DFQ30_009642 [Apophysomyces sp. BC1015]KAG0191762.1 hypothetical protein DFQ28_010972 [Apophysomyces sp. BC1034]